MKKEEIDQYQYQKILEYVVPVFMNRGLKSTTMDALASALKISKRTLYEIFGSKEDLFSEALKYFHNRMAEELKKIFANSENVMEGIIKSFLYNRDMMSNVSAAFIRDTEQFVKDKVKADSPSPHIHQNLYNILQKGVKEGYFREDMNLMVQCRMLALQMESLKRTEELFPDDITLLDVYDNIIIGFLRGLSSQKGLEELEKFMPSLTQSYH